MWTECLKTHQKRTGKRRVKRKEGDQKGMTRMYFLKKTQEILTPEIYTNKLSFPLTFCELSLSRSVVRNGT